MLNLKFSTRSELEVSRRMYSEKSKYLQRSYSNSNIIMNSDFDVALSNYFITVGTLIINEESETKCVT